MNNQGDFTNQDQLKKGFFSYPVSPQVTYNRVLESMRLNGYDENDSKSLNIPSISHIPPSSLDNPCELLRYLSLVHENSSSTLGEAGAGSFDADMTNGNKTITK